MTSNELRIGNYVYFHGDVKEINMVDGFGVIGRKEQPLFSIDEFEPIPLTEEWLLRFGFELDIEDDGYQKGKYKVSVSDEGCLFFIYMGYYPEEIAEFKYVHQLQNLYFALTGKELILN